LWRGRHEEERENESFESSPEEEKYEKIIEKIQGRKKVS